jgi:hypothetical protein
MIIIMNKICALLFFASILDAHALVCMEPNKRQPHTSHRSDERTRSERINMNLIKLSSRYHMRCVEKEHMINTMERTINTIDDRANVLKLCNEQYKLTMESYIIARTWSDFNKAIEREPTVSMAVDYSLREYNLYNTMFPEMAQEIKNSFNVHTPLPGSSSK